MVHEPHYFEDDIVRCSCGGPVTAEVSFWLSGQSHIEYRGVCENTGMTIPLEGVNRRIRKMLPSVD